MTGTQSQTAQINQKSGCKQVWWKLSLTRVHGIKPAYHQFSPPVSGINLCHGHVGRARAMYLEPGPCR